MLKAPILPNEDERLKAVLNMGILDTEPEERFDAITKEAMERFGVPMCTISIIDSEREWFKSCQGMVGKEGKREISFCGHAMLSKFLFVVEDTLKDERFLDNPHVVGLPYVRFYAGMALRDRKNNVPIGAFCIKDTVPRTMNPEDVAAIIDFANRAEEELNKQ